MTATKRSTKSSSKTSSSARTRLTTHITSEIDTTSHTLELTLLLLSLATGMQDAIAAVDFHCFASNQTGNTILVMVGLLIPANERIGYSLPLRDCGISLGTYVAGIFLNGQIANRLDSIKRRWWLVLSSILQTALVFGAAAAHHASPIPGDVAIVTNGGTKNWAELALLAFASGMQVGMVRALKITDITTANATATWVDIMIDCKLFSGLTKNRPRNRRIGFIASLAGGACIGALLKRRVGSGITVVVTAVIKLFCCLLIWYVREEEDRGSVYWIV